MSRNNNKEILKDLKDRFLNGDKLTVEEITKDYFAPTSTFNYLIAKEQSKHLLTSVKGWFRKEHQLWFGNIDDKGKYGLFTNEAEVRYGMTKYYRFVKGILHNANLLVTNAKDKGMLPVNITTEKMLVARIGEEENGDKKSTH